MAKNLTRKTFFTDCEWTAPIEVTSVTVTTIPTNALVDINGGENQSTLIRSDQIAFAWGANVLGQLGDGTLTNRCYPTSLACNYIWRSIVSHFQSAIGLAAGGKAYGWGLNANSEIGNNTASCCCVPSPICCNFYWKSLAAGAYHSIGLRTDGTIWGWGYSDTGAIGENCLVSSRCQPTALCSTLKFKYVSAGRDNSAAISETGDAYVWGLNNGGQIGNCLTTGCYCCPTAVCGGLKFKILEAANVRTYGITEDGDLYAWGNGAYGALGTGNINDACVPTQVCAGVKWKGIYPSKHIASLSAAAITVDGDLYTWGGNVAGMLGLGHTNCVCVPTLVCCGIKWKSAAMGISHTIGISEDGFLYSWGDAKCGKLGNCTTTPNTCVPSLICGIIPAGVTEPIFRRNFAIQPLCTYCVKIASTYASFNHVQIADFTGGLILEYFS